MDSGSDSKVVARGTCGVCGGVYYYEKGCLPSTIVYCQNCKTALFAGSGNAAPTRERMSGCTTVIAGVGILLLIPGFFFWPLLGVSCLLFLIAAANYMMGGKTQYVVAEEGRRRKRFWIVVGALVIGLPLLGGLIVAVGFLFPDSAGKSDKELEVRKMMKVYPKSGVAAVARDCYGFVDRDALERVKGFRRNLSLVKDFADEFGLTDGVVLIHQGDDVSIQSSAKGVREVLTRNGERVWIFADCLKASGR